MAKKKHPPRAFVLDGSMALAWCFPEEKADHPAAVLDALAKTSACVPSLWHPEVANALIMAERRKRSTEADMTNWLGFLRSLPIHLDDQTTDRAWADTLHLARVHGLTASDAAYLELALRRGLAVATLDDQLKAAMKAAGVAEFQP